MSLNWLSSLFYTKAKPIGTIATAPASGSVFDFSDTPLSKDYPGKPRVYIKILDGVFSPEECAALVKFAETGVFEPTVSREGVEEWQPAQVNTGRKSRNILDTEYRNSDRILRFSIPVSSWVYNRLLPHLPELVEISPGTEWETVVGKPGGGEVWRMVGMNERLSFLRYKSGMYFKEHCDSHVTLKDGRCGRVTVQVYLSSGVEKGGATRIWSRDMKRYVDVEAKMGRVLVFQHRGVLHSGEAVVEGVKLAMRGDLMFRSERNIPVDN